VPSFVPAFVYHSCTLGALFDSSVFSIGNSLVCVHSLRDHSFLSDLGLCGMSKIEKY
jgi:hypothetical protein